MAQSRKRKRLTAKQKAARRKAAKHRYRRRVAQDVALRMLHGSCIHPDVLKVAEAMRHFIEVMKKRNSTNKRG
jgi:hypothetical protein